MLFKGKHIPGFPKRKQARKQFPGGYKTSALTSISQAMGFSSFSALGSNKLSTFAFPILWTNTSDIKG